jgi:hypothetical protein
LWVEAAELAALVPETRSRSFKNALAELTGVEARDLPLERHHVVWDAFVPGPGENVVARLDRARSLLRAAASA